MQLKERRSRRQRTLDVQAASGGKWMSWSMASGESRRARRDSTKNGIRNKTKRK